ncbi:hypothetical protein BCV70DRAFT_197514 [Testicularia cyperi]|uniref:Uncharacterized protein n=1 Tax=Testicularia cyperi TaxID=1882483 RepID=A0A317XYA8_9BASI|nr:hypothetical protein BCV70DRAFT_197514 [Testicularia cyperi]
MTNGYGYDGGKKITNIQYSTGSRANACSARTFVSAVCECGVLQFAKTEKNPGGPDGTCHTKKRLSSVGRSSRSGNERHSTSTVLFRAVATAADRKSGWTSVFLMLAPSHALHARRFLSHFNLQIRFLTNLLRLLTNLLRALVVSIARTLELDGHSTVQFLLSRHWIDPGSATGGPTCLPSLAHVDGCMCGWLGASGLEGYEE